MRVAGAAIFTVLDRTSLIGPRRGSDLEYLPFHLRHAEEEVGPRIKSGVTVLIWWDFVFAFNLALRTGFDTGEGQAQVLRGILDFARYGRDEVRIKPKSAR